MRVQVPPLDLAVLSDLHDLDAALRGLDLAPLDLEELVHAVRGATRRPSRTATGSDRVQSRLRS